MKKKKIKKITIKKIEILPTDDLRTIIDKMDKIRVVKVPGNDSVKFIRKNR